MDFVDRIRDLSDQIPTQLEYVTTEEATKTALVMPFIAALGYEVFNPREVVPEYTADVGIKKGEKVDYVIMRDSKPCMLIECKDSGCDLDQAHMSQLYRYFSVTEARFGVLTNGVEYRFFTDLDAPNRMDSKPFLEMSMLNFNGRMVEEVRKFTKHSFDLESILDTASDLKYTKGIKRAFAEEWTNPSEDFVRMFAGKVYSGRMTQSAREQFSPIVKRGFQEFISDRVSERLKKALAREEVTAAPLSQSKEESEREADLDAPEEKGIETTEEEIEAFYIVKAIVRESVDVKRVFIRDTMSYCSALLDDNNRKPICRLYFNSSQRYIGIFDEQKNVSRHPISSIDEIYSFSDELRRTSRQYDQN